MTCRGRTTTLALLAGLIAVAVCGCVRLPRYPAVASGSAGLYPIEALAWSMNPWVLSSLATRRLVIEVDWVEGCRPGPRTLDGLRKTLERYSPPGRPFEIVVDEEIPRAEWEACCRTDPTTLVATHLDRTSSYEQGIEVNYVLVAPYQEGDRGLFGYSTTWVIERAGKPLGVEGVSIFRDAHDRWAVLWFTRDRIERMTLIHEYGHVLGLVANPRHERRHRGHRHHCTGLSCQMAHPTKRVVLRNFWPGLFNQLPDGYCKRCQEDIRRSQEFWRAHAEDRAFVEELVQRRRELHVNIAAQKSEDEGQLGHALELYRQAQETSAASSWARWREAGVLLRLGRVAEALAAADAGAVLETADWVRRGQRLWFARALAEQACYAEVLDQVTKAVARGAAERPNSLEVEAWALTGLGRLVEAAASVERAERSLARETSNPTSTSFLRLRRAALLRRAGSLTEARQLVEAGLGLSRQRSWWLIEAARLARAEDRPEEARMLLREAARGRGRAKDGRDEMRRALALALLGETEAARTMLEDFSRRIGPERRVVVAMVRAQVSAILGDGEEAARALRELPARARNPWFDVCLDEDLELLRHDARHQELFAHCPPASAMRP